VSAVIAGAIFLGPSTASADTLRLLTWSDYAPDEVIAQFKQETGIDVEVTLSNNEEMISKLRATGGAGFDLVQPSQDRIVGAQADYGIYKPIDLGKINADLFIPSMLEAVKTNSTVQGQVYGVPYTWGTSGLVVNTKAADYSGLCGPDLAGRVSYRLKRPTLIAFAFAMGKDPFAAYADKDAYGKILDQVAANLVACKKNVKAYWTGGDQLMNLIRSGEVVAAMAWDAGGWKLNGENPDIQFIAPRSGALGWIDTFALPAKGKNDEAAYKWINFVMQPEIAGKVTNVSSTWTASKGADKYVSEAARKQFTASFSQAAIDNIKWYPPVPPGLEDMESKVLDQIKAAKSN
jgi:spermidine/putrescine transport system substrate-binding protein